MAVLLPPSARVETAAGAAISGGKLRVYTVNTTTLASTYSDEALATPLTNPVVADSNGFLPQIFLAEATYDIAYLDASSVALAGQAYTDWPSIDIGTANTFQRDVSGARFKFSGGDIGDGTTGVLLEAGDPSPDVTGGNLRLGGWAATVLDKLRIDVTALTITGATAISGALNAVGRITENSKKLMGVVQTEGTFSGATSVEITLPDTPTNVRGWMIEIIDFVTTANTAQSIGAQFSYDGSTYKSGASDYNWTAVVITSSAAAGGGASTGVDTLINLTNSTNANIEPQRALLRLEIITPLSGSDYTNVRYRFEYTTTTNLAHRLVMGTGVGKGGYGRVQKVKIVASSTNISGTYRIVPLRGFGE